MLSCSLRFNYSIVHHPEISSDRFSRIPSFIVALFGMASFRLLVSLTVLTVLWLRSCEVTLALSIDSQIAGAFKAASSSGSLIACVSKNASIVLSYAVDDGGTSLFRISDSICMAIEGISADALYVADKAIEEHAEHLFVYDSEIPLRRLAGAIAQMVHRRTLSPFMRPFGIRSLFSGIDGTDHQPQLLEVDPLGSVHSCRLVFVSPYPLSSIWGKDIDPNDLSTQQCLEKCLATLREALSSANEELDFTRVKVAVVDSQSCRLLEGSAVERGIESGDLGSNTDKRITEGTS